MWGLRERAGARRETHQQDDLRGEEEVFVRLWVVVGAAADAAEHLHHKGLPELPPVVEQVARDRLGLDVGVVRPQEAALVLRGVGAKRGGEA